MAVPGAFMGTAGRAASPRGSPAGRAAHRRQSWSKAARTTQKMKAYKGGHTYPKYNRLQPLARGEYYQIRRAVDELLVLDLDEEAWDSPGFVVPPLKLSPSGSPNGSGRSKCPTTPGSSSSRVTSRSSSSRVTSRSSSSGKKNSKKMDKKKDRELSPTSKALEEMLRSASRGGRKGGKLYAALDFSVEGGSSPKAWKYSDSSAKSRITRGRDRDKGDYHGVSRRLFTAGDQ